MFERFTDRARRVLVLAQEEARLLSHPMIGTDHVLLGLLAEGDGVASRALSGGGVDLGIARQVVEEFRSPGGPHPYAGSPPFTTEAKKALELALREALSMGHSYIGTEHLLLGLLDVDEVETRAFFEALEVDTEALRLRVTDLIEGGTPIELPYDADTRKHRIHILEGLVRAIELSGEVIDAVAHCTDRRDALRALIGPPFGFSELQAAQVLDLRVLSVTDEYRARLAAELEELKAADTD